MTKSLYDPEVEKKGIEKGYEEIVLNMFGQGLDESTISKFTKLDIEKVKEITKKHLNQQNGRDELISNSSLLLNHTL